jgi:type II secretory pathway component PulK
MEDNSLELAMATREVDRSRLRMDAMSELELALAVIAEIRSIDLNKIHDPAQGYDDPHKYAGIPVREGLEVNFEYEDESGKLPLATLDKNTIIQLLYSLGLEQRDAERVADAMVAWTSKKYESIEEEATDAAYQRAKLPLRNSGPSASQKTSSSTKTAIPRGSSGTSSNASACTPLATRILIPPRMRCSSRKASMNASWH